ncbi:MAG: biotin--[acetyl-CoA-carboxylase] ligase, partial [Thermoanaerobacterium sp.]|nr:biotin--[acetyl-CoA-carboxylase] ligase [Thermoanaerobacterium sp.]
GRNYLYFDSISSTNDYAKEIALNSPDGTTIVAEEQTSGRGRMGRLWVSYKKQGIWMSIILKPDIAPNDAVKLTQVAAVSLVDAIKETANLISYIKWPNDIIVSGKKVCGILTEMNGEIDKINFIVVGIGVNVNVDSFPVDLQDKATSLSIEASKKIDRKLLTASILNNFEKYYRTFLDEGFLNIRNLCKEYSLTLEKDVKVIIGNKEYVGRAIDIDDDGNLIIMFKNGEKKAITSGEVSIRGLTDYI